MKPDSWETLRSRFVGDKLRLTKAKCVARELPTLASLLPWTWMGGW